MYGMHTAIKPGQSGAYQYVEMFLTLVMFIFQLFKQYLGVGGCVYDMHPAAIPVQIGVYQYV